MLEGSDLILPHTIASAAVTEGAPHAWQVGSENHEVSSNEEFKPLGDIYALGDCSANVEGPLPALAQVIGACLALASHQYTGYGHSPLKRTARSLSTHPWSTL